MTDNHVAEMTDLVNEADQEIVIEEAPKQLTLTIHVPDRFTMGMWKCYNGARRAWMDKNPNGDPMEARFIGSLALIKAEWCRLEGIPEAAQIRAQILSGDTDSLDLALIGTVVRYISYPLEAAFDAPFLLPQSSSIGTTKSTTSAQSN